MCWDSAGLHGCNVGQPDSACDVSSKCSQLGLLRHRGCSMEYCASWRSWISLAVVAWGNFKWGHRRNSGRSMARYSCGNTYWYVVCSLLNSKMLFIFFRNCGENTVIEKDKLKKILQVTTLIGFSFSYKMFIEIKIVVNSCIAYLCVQNIVV